MVILSRKIALPIFVLFILFTSMFISLVSIYYMPERIMGANDVYVLTSANDNNPIRSNLNIGIAYGLENMSYIEAVSPEIFVFTVLKNQPVTVRGVIFKNFLKLENGHLIEGSIPHELSGALVGCNVAHKLHINVGDKFALYGSFTSSIAEINVTGIYRTGSSPDDEILVSLPTARKLAGIQKGDVSVIRVKTQDEKRVHMLMDPNYPKFTVSINSSAHIYMGSKLTVSITIKNMGKEQGYANLSVRFENQYYNSTELVYHDKKLNVSFFTRDSGKYNVTAIVKNNVFYYTCYTQVDVTPRPVLIKGPIFTFENESTAYTLTSINNESIETGILFVNTTGYQRKYSVTGTLNITFPKEGNYTLTYVGKNYSKKEINVSVYKRVPMSVIAILTPTPINNTIYAIKGSSVKIDTEGTAYYAINNGSYIIGNKVNVSSHIIGNFVLRVRVVKGMYMAEEKYLVHPVENTSPELNSPVKNGDKVVYGEILKFKALDSVPIERISYTVNGNKHVIQVNQNFNPYVFNYSYSFQIPVNATHLMMNISVIDAWNRGAYLNASCNVIVNKDIIKPEIIAQNVKIWGGNRTEVIIKDNVEVSNVSVLFYGHYFNDTNVNSPIAKVYISTMFRSGDKITFVPPGTYMARVIAYDNSGNFNETNFTITIDNENEKNPPVIAGDTFIDLSDGSYEYRAFDNVGVINMTCYDENGNPVAYSSNSFLNLTSSEFSNGTHKVLISAKDKNGNIGYLSVLIVKNYTDTNPPEIHVSQLKIWSGNNTLIWATDKVDNRFVSRISVHVFGRYFNGTKKVVIKTEYLSENGIYFIAPGTYTMNVTAWNIDGYKNTTQFLLIVNNSGEKNPPVIVAPSFIKVNATDNITVKAFDNVAVKSMWVNVGNITVYRKYGNVTNFSASLLPCGYSTITIFAQDINNNVNQESIKVLVEDNIPPWLKYKEERIWGGNTTVIIGQDNVRVAYINATFDGINYASSNGTLWIPTVYEKNNSIYYIPQGIYNITVWIEDSSGNINKTVFQLIIDNKDERIPPVITGPSRASVNRTCNVTFVSFDNVGVKSMWAVYEGHTFVNAERNEITITYSMLPGGWRNITIFAEDVNGNIAKYKVQLYVETTKKIDVYAHFQNGVVSSKEQAILLVDVVNHDMPTQYTLTIKVDNHVYYQEDMFLDAYERRSLYIYLPILSPGKHHISVGKDTLTLTVEKSLAEKLPTELVLKYAKTLKFSESKTLIYKGFEISEGNFLLVIIALITITMVLVLFGIYSTAIKSMNNNNVGILRAIGASHVQLFLFMMNDAWKYVLLPVITGIVGGYLLIIGINHLDLLTAFGHHLIIVPTLSDILTVVVLSIAFSIAAIMLIFMHIISGHVVHAMGRDREDKITNLDDILN